MVVVLKALLFAGVTLILIFHQNAERLFAPIMAECNPFIRHSINPSLLGDLIHLYIGFNYQFIVSARTLGKRSKLIITT